MEINAVSRAPKMSRPLILIGCAAVALGGAAAIVYILISGGGGKKVQLYNETTVAYKI